MIEQIIEKPSRTQKKKEALAVQKIGEELVYLNHDQLTGLGLPAELLEAVAAARRIKQHVARRRQLQYIGSLVRRIDSHAIELIQRKIAEI